jgi:hypothetical protein
VKEFASPTQPSPRLLSLDHRIETRSWRLKLSYYFVAIALGVPITVAHMSSEANVGSVMDVRWEEYCIPNHTKLK